MDLSVIAEALVVVVIGGLGSLPGTFLAAMLVAELNAFGILVLPGMSMALAFVVMARRARRAALGPAGQAGGARAAASGAVDYPLAPVRRARPRSPLLRRSRSPPLLPLVAGPYLARRRDAKSRSSCFTRRACIS